MHVHHSCKHSLWVYRVWVSVLAGALAACSLPSSGVDTTKVSLDIGPLTDPAAAGFVPLGGDGFAEREIVAVRVRISGNGMEPIVVDVPADTGRTELDVPSGPGRLFEAVAIGPADPAGVDASLSAPERAIFVYAGETTSDLAGGVVPVAIALERTPLPAQDVTGTVVDTTGAPVEFARLLIHLPELAFAAAYGDDQRTAGAAADGSAAASPGAFRVPVPVLDLFAVNVMALHLDGSLLGTAVAAEGMQITLNEAAPAQLVPGAGRIEVTIAASADIAGSWFVALYDAAGAYLAGRSARVGEAAVFAAIDAGAVTAAVLLDGRVVGTGSAVIGDGDSTELTIELPDTLFDTDAPNTTIQTQPDSPTQSQSASFRFVASEAGSRFECSLDNAPYSPCTSPQVYSNLSEGSHVFAVRAIDAAGNVDATPATYTWTIDRTAPNTLLSSGPPSLVAATSVQIDLSSNEIGVTYECSVDGGSYSACSDPATFSGLAQGPHIIEVRAVDAAGNADPTPLSVVFSVDSVAPTGVTIVAPALAATDGTVQVLLSASDPNGPIEVQLNGDIMDPFRGIYQPLTSPITVTLANGDAVNTITARYRDAAGNETALQTVLVTFDNLPPTASLTQPTALSVTAVVPALAGISTDPGNAPSGVTGVLMNIFAAADGYYWDGVSSFSPSAPVPVWFAPTGLDSWLYAPTAGAALLQSQTIYVTLRVWDAAGNRGEVTEWFFVDQDPPTGSIAFACGELTNQLLQTLHLAATDTTLPLTMRLSGDISDSFNGVWQAFSTPVSVTLTPGDGIKVVNVEYRDAASNVTGIFSDTVTLDTTTPTALLWNPLPGSVLAAFPSLVTGTAADGGAAPSGVTWVSVSAFDGTFYYDGSSFASLAEVTFAATGTDPWSWGGLYSASGIDATYTLNIYPKDAVGNIGFNVYTFDLDQTPPSCFSCIVINSGAAVTNTTTVVIAMDADDAVEMRLTGDISNGFVGQWILYQSTTNVTLLAGPDGTRTVLVEFRDSIGNVTSVFSDSIELDTVAPTASLVAGVPGDPSNATSLNIDVGGGDVVAYRYKIQTTSSTECQVPSGYSTERPEGENISDNISALPDGIVYLCVIGRDVAGNWQSFTAASILQWTKDTTPPASFNISGISGGGDAVVDAWFSGGGSPQVAIDVPITEDIEVWVRDGFNIAPICGPFTLPGGSQWVTLTACVLSEATQYAVSMTATDLAGNVTVALNQPFPFTVDTMPPLAPVGLNAIRVAPGAIQITWSPLGGDVADYLLHYDSDAPGAPYSGTDANEGASFIVLADPVTQITLTGLDPAKAYYIALQARDFAQNVGVFSAEVTVPPQLPLRLERTEPAFAAATTATWHWIYGSGFVGRGAPEVMLLDSYGKSTSAITATVVGPQVIRMRVPAGLLPGQYSVSVTFPAVATGASSSLQFAVQTTTVGQFTPRAISSTTFPTKGLATFYDESRGQQLLATCAALFALEGTTVTALVGELPNTTLPNCKEVVAADLDGDGLQDLVYVGGDQNRVFRNTGIGFLDQTGSWLPADPLPDADNAAVAADFNGDGDLDLFVCNKGQQSYVLSNNGAGVMLLGTAGTDYPSSTLDCSDAAVADLDQDGDVDLVISTTTGASVWWENNGGGRFLAEYAFSSSTLDHSSANVGDLDGDGDEDVFLATYNAASVWYRNDGGGVFTPVSAGVPVEAYPVMDSALGDIDGDGDLDIVLVNNNPTLSDRIWLNDGGATSFTPRDVDSNLFQLAEDVVLADIDQDTDIDILTTQTDPGKGTYLFINEWQDWQDLTTVQSGFKPLPIGRTSAMGMFVDRNTGQPKLIFFGGQDDAVSYNTMYAMRLSDQVWADISNFTNAPTARSNVAGTVVDVPNGPQQLLVWGSHDNPVLDDAVYHYDITADTWQSYTPPLRPAGAGGATLTWVPSEGKAVLFGGSSDQTALGATAEVWYYDPDTQVWSNPNLLVGSEGINYPNRRFLHAAVAVMHVVYVFGGTDSNGLQRNDIWRLDVAANQWTEVSPQCPGGPNCPSGRSRSSMFYDPTRHWLVVFSGDNVAAALSDTWAYSLDDHAWQQICQSCNTPTGSAGTIHVYDPFERAFLWFGGSGDDGTSYLDELWRLWAK